jgi:hypothetical protein
MQNCKWRVNLQQSQTATNICALLGFENKRKVKTRHSRGLPWEQTSWTRRFPVYTIVCPLPFHIYFQNAHNTTKIVVHFIFKACCATSSETISILYPMSRRFFLVQELSMFSFQLSAWDVRCLFYWPIYRLFYWVLIIEYLLLFVLSFLPIVRPLCVFIQVCCYVILYYILASPSTVTRLSLCQDLLAYIACYIDFINRVFMIFPLGYLQNVRMLSSFIPVCFK